MVVLTDWPEFRGLDSVKIADAVRTPVVVDTRNLIDRDVLSRAGLHCHSLGRPPGDHRPMVACPPASRQRNVRSTS